MQADVTALLIMFLKVEPCLLSLEAVCTGEAFRHFVSELLLGTFFYFSDGLRKLAEANKLVVARRGGSGWDGRSSAEIQRLEQVLRQSSEGAKVRVHEWRWQVRAL